MIKPLKEYKLKQQKHLEDLAACLKLQNNLIEVKFAALNY